MKRFINLLFPLLFGVVLSLTGCVTIKPPQWRAVDETREAQYEPYLGEGTGSITGQAFLTQMGGGVVTAAGRVVTLDPATDIGTEWWTKAGIYYVHKGLVPPSASFLKARKTTTADAEGRFKFENLRPGKYYIRTEVTWYVGYNIQGGLVGQLVEVKSDKTVELIINQYAH
ncbi:MAG: hypothetical protein JW739_05740 [Opitutales bacterium]|nr:hypothetical protein [Opitutales bacterium]